MQFTPNLNLKKPDGSDYVNIGDLNANADALDTAIGNLQNSQYSDAKAVAAVKAADGPESGLDADTLDGKHASSFVETDASAAGLFHIIGDGPTPILVIPDGTGGAWKSVGPTGSGCDYICAGLDSIPAGAKAIRLHVWTYLNHGTGAASSLSASVKVRARGSAATVSDVTSLTAYLSSLSLHAGATVDVKLDANKTFEIYWTKGSLSGSSFSTTFSLLGYYK